ncbi:MAG TPA: ATP-binding cassette domain-containing protein [Candidatus Limnocylindrales bacterium]|jgi:simple sugar transport system ATP-binding protein
MTTDASQAPGDLPKQQADANADSRGEIAIEATGVAKRFGHLEALRGASLTVHNGEIVALVGDNGAGKTTFANILCGALHPDEGTLAYWGQPVEVQSIGHAHELGVGVVYQNLSLALDLSVTDNLYLGREQRRPGWRSWFGLLDRPRMREEGRAALARLGIKLRAMNVPVRNLSGGQRQALAVARAMLWARRAILMDEPTAALGPKQTGIVFETVRRAADDGLAVLVISHDIPRMLTVADRIAVMRHGVVVAVRPAAALHMNDVIGLMLGVEAPAA